MGKVKSEAHVGRSPDARLTSILELSQRCGGYVRAERLHWPLRIRLVLLRMVMTLWRYLQLVRSACCRNKIVSIVYEGGASGVWVSNEALDLRVTDVQAASGLRVFLDFVDDKLQGFLVAA